MTNSSESQGRTPKDIATELRFAAEDMRINRLTVEQMKERYSHMLKFLDYLEESNPELKVKAAEKVQETMKQQFMKIHNIH